MPLQPSESHPTDTASSDSAEPVPRLRLTTASNEFAPGHFPSGHFAPGEPVSRGRFLPRHNARAIERGNVIFVEFCDRPWFTEPARKHSRRQNTMAWLRRLFSPKTNR